MEGVIADRVYAGQQFIVEGTSKNCQLQTRTYERVSAKNSEFIHKPRLRSRYSGGFRGASK